MTENLERIRPRIAPFSRTGGIADPMSRKSAESKTLRLALVGCGAISKMHRIGIRDGAPRIEITAAVDVNRTNAAAVASETGAEVFESLDAALESRCFDAVDLMLPHQLHESAALRCLEAGVHVLLEKPMATSVGACARILEAARQAAERNGSVFMVAENSQYWPEVVTAKRLIDEGVIGDVVTARAAIFFPPMGDYYGEEKGGEKPWRFDNAAAGGGIALDTGSHWIRPLRIWLGEVDEVVAALGHPFGPMEGESLVRSLFRFRTGVVASFDALLSEAPMSPEPLFRITGTRGEITIDGLGRATVFDAQSRRGRPEGEPGGYMMSYAGEFEDFAAAVLDGRPLAAGPEEALGELRTALALYRSAESRGWEKVWDVEAGS
jgi:UDP-N-acetyl-2-amino-2-deoxyglucuronate dehydrogenase